MCVPTTRPCVFFSIQQDHALTSLSSKSWSSSLGKSPATLPPHCSPPHWGNRRSLCHPHCSPPGRFARSAKEKALAAGRRQSRPVAAPSSSRQCPQLLRHPRTRGEAVRLLPCPPFLAATLLVLASPLSLFHGPREFTLLENRRFSFDQLKRHGIGYAMLNFPYP